jgi:FkbM family methyltransferase
MLRRSFAIAGVVLLLLLGLLYADAPLTLKTYFRLESVWAEHWPVTSEQGLFEALEPGLRKARFLRPARVEVEPGVSFFLDPRDLIPVTILRTGQWQPEIWDSLRPSLPAGGVFLDVGAHIGYFSIKAAPRIGPTGHVVSFEPNPETVALLRDNVEANRASNVTIEPIACTDREQTLTLYATSIANTGASSLARDNAKIWGGAPRAYQVRARPIDDVIRELNLSRVDAVKVDVEGAEVSVLRGAIGTLKRFHPKLVVEVSRRQLASFQTTPEELAALIKSAGYNYARSLNANEEDWEWTVANAHDFASTISVADPSVARQFIRGILSGEGAARWTEPTFAVALQTPPGANVHGAWLSLKLYVAEPSIKALKAITLSAKAGDAVLQPETFTRDGVYEYRRQLPSSALSNDILQVDFSVDKFLTVESDNLGIMIMTASLAAAGQ